MKSRRLHILAFFLCLACGTHAAPVDMAEACRVARCFLFSPDLVAQKVCDEFYLVTPVRGDGFVLVSADNCVRPVLAWSPNGHFPVMESGSESVWQSNMPSHVAAWLDGYRRDIASLVAAGANPSVEVKAMWDNPRPKKDVTAVGPLLTTTWAQLDPYNRLCPYDTVDSARCAVGCVATATAQIMKYWNTPAVGFNDYSYNSPYGNLSADFGHTHYQWDIMPDILTPTSDSAAVMAVAKLMYHVGVAIKTSYGTEGSSSSINSYGSHTFPCSENALKNYFRYNPMLYSVYKLEYSDTRWNAILVAEIEAGRPVLYSGFSPGGHAFVLDGIDGNGMFHVNWGWNGGYDGYYTIDSLSPGAGNYGGDAICTYNIDNTAVVGIEPAPPESDSDMVIIDMRYDTAFGYVDGNGRYDISHRYYIEKNIYAIANEGYRFVHWESGSTNNPVHIWTTQNLLMMDSAIFEPVCGDTVDYSIGSCMTMILNGNCPWAIRLPANTHVGRCSLTSVQFVPTATGHYRVSLYIGDTIADSTRVYSAQHEIVTEWQLQNWETHMITHPISIADSDIVWIELIYDERIENYDIIPRPMASARCTGNYDGQWMYFCYENHWENRFPLHYTWMIRGIFSRCPVNVAVETNLSDAQMAELGVSITGAGDYIYGDTVCLSVETGVPVSWTWNTSSLWFLDNDNPNCFVATTDTVLHVNFFVFNDLGDVEADGVEVRVVGRDVTVDAPRGAGLGVYDMQGRLLSTSNTFTAPAAGIYMIKIDGIPAKKIVIQ